MRRENLVQDKCYSLQKIPVTTEGYITTHSLFQHKNIYTSLENQKLVSSILKSSISGLPVQVQSRRIVRSGLHAKMHYSHNI